MVGSFTTNQVSMVRAAAWLTLAKLNGDPVAEAIGRISLQENGPHVIPNDAYAVLEEMGPEAKAAVPSLIYCLKSDHVGTLIRTIEALGKIGPAAHEALEPLRQLRQHPEADVREKAEASLREISAR
jgi:HEAT repeat protein